MRAATGQCFGKPALSSHSKFYKQTCTALCCICLFLGAPLSLLLQRSGKHRWCDFAKGAAEWLLFYKKPRFCVVVSPPGKCYNQRTNEMQKGFRIVNTLVQKENRRKKSLYYWEKSCSILGMVIMGTLYLFMVDNYVAEKICMVRGSFLVLTILYAGACVVLGAGRVIRGQVQRIASGRLCGILLRMVVPLWAFYICEIIYNTEWTSMRLQRIGLNYLFLGLLELFLLLVCRKKRTAYRILLLFGWVYGVANYYVLEFKGNPLLPSDLLSYKTAMGVVENYVFYLADSIVTGTLLLFWGLAVVQIFTMQVRLTRRKYRFRIAMGLGVLVLSLWGIGKINWSEIMQIQMNAWQPQLTYNENGGVLAFVLEAQSMSMEAPAGYVKKEVKQLLEQYAPEETKTQQQPSVIVIMNESFSNLREIGSFVSEEYLENWNHMKDYVRKGKVYSSVYGGGTCNAEFEFLTGHSMANLSGIVYPYQTYNLNGISNLASVFSQAGYKTVAMHLEAATNWNRQKVYQQLGFEEFISIEDMEEVEYIRTYASDAYDYDLIQQVLAESEEPLFLFNVTIQNHGGYEGDMTGEGLEMVELGSDYEQYGDVQNFLTLMKESDRAFAELLENLSQLEEPVIVCLFGDHQPAISTDFIEEIRDKEAEGVERSEVLYATPYVIWTNYETEQSKQTLDTSLNYLGMNVLELAGIQTAYGNYLTQLQKKFPVINTVGRKSWDGSWLSNDVTVEMLAEYRRVQYYMLFEQ